MSTSCPFHVLRALALSAAGLAAAGCVTTSPMPPPPAPVDDETAVEIDAINRLSEYLARTPPEETGPLMTSLERLLVAWQAEQRQGRAEPMETIVNRKVVANFDTLADAFVTGTHERRIVAAWALGFARVPENPLDIPSRHGDARELLVAAMDDATDDLMRNLLLALWKLGDPDTPLAPVMDIVVDHHDAEVRANAALALGAILDEVTARTAVETVLVALSDSEPKVRLHATGIASAFPDPATTRHLRTLLPKEATPLVRAGMARALGAARDRPSASMLAAMLSSPREIESSCARTALVAIFGEDLGPHAANWESVLP